MLSVPIHTLRVGDDVRARISSSGSGEHITVDHPYYAWAAEQARLEEMRLPPPPDLDNPYDCWGTGTDIAPPDAIT